MNITKKIFSQKLIIINLYLHPMFKYFGSRIIDTLIHTPLSYINNNYKESYDINEVGKIITLDLQVLKHITGYNNKSPKNYYNNKIKTNFKYSLKFQIFLY